MKKILLATAILFFAFAAANANPVTPRDAARVAATFWQHRFGTPSAMVESPSSANYPGLYIFNNNKSAGFVIVASDDRATPILGYSDEQPADAAVPANVNAWLRDYSDAVLYCVSHDIPATDQIASQWARLREGAPLHDPSDPDGPSNAVAALLTTT